MVFGPLARKTLRAVSSLHLREKLTGQDAVLGVVQQGTLNLEQPPVGVAGVVCKRPGGDDAGEVGVQPTTPRAGHDHQPVVKGVSRR